MISEGRMFGSIDQLQAIVYFKREFTELALQSLRVCMYVCVCLSVVLLCISLSAVKDVCVSVVSFLLNSFYL